MAERQRRTAVSIIEEIQSRKTAATDKLATLHARQDALLVTIATLTDLLDAVDGSGDAEG